MYGLINKSTDGVYYLVTGILDDLFEIDLANKLKKYLEPEHLDLSGTDYYEDYLSDNDWFMVLLIKGKRKFFLYEQSDHKFPHIIEDRDKYVWFSIVFVPFLFELNRTKEMYMDASKFLRTPNTIHIDFNAQPLVFIFTCFILLFVLFWAYIGNTRIVNYLFKYKFIDSIYKNFEYKALNYFLNKYMICLFVIGIWSTIGMRIFGWTHNVSLFLFSYANFYVFVYTVKTY